MTRRKETHDLMMISEKRRMNKLRETHDET